MTPLELMALADCQFRSSAKQLKMQEAFLEVRDTMGLPSMLLTIVTGSLIIALSQQHKYPYRFIYLICFC